MALRAFSGLRCSSAGNMRLSAATSIASRRLEREAGQNVELMGQVYKYLTI
jgi:hypothetical protein